MLSETGLPKNDAAARCVNMMSRSSSSSTNDGTHCKLAEAPPACHNSMRMGPDASPPSENWTKPMKPKACGRRVAIAFSTSSRRTRRKRDASITRRQVGPMIRMKLSGCDTSSIQPTIISPPFCAIRSASIDPRASRGAAAA